MGPDHSTVRGGRWEQLGIIHDTCDITESFQKPRKKQLFQLAANFVHAMLAIRLGARYIVTVSGQYVSVTILECGYMDFSYCDNVRSVFANPVTHF